MHVLIILTLSILLTSASHLEDVQVKREQLYQDDLKMMFGNDIALSECEVKANKTIMDLKLEELNEGYANPRNFTLAKHFFHYNDAVKSKELFKMLKKMPKGALLHAHDTGMLGPDYLLKITYMKNLYVCLYGDNEVSFYFSKTVPKINTNCPCHSKWQLMKDARYSTGNVRQFDEKLRKHFTMNPEEKNVDVSTAWRSFQKYFMVTAPLIQYKPVWEQYFNDTLRALRRDGIMYLEIRSMLPQLYDLDGNVYDSVATAESYKKVVDDFKLQFPDFFGAKLIYAPPRLVNRKTLLEYFKTAREIKKRMPCFLAGFDLVGQEDLGQPLKAFLPELVEATKDFDMFFHAGETNWNGAATDENLYDAIALGAKRIGHGYSILNHPVLMNEVKRKDIPLEVNIISNVVLKLTNDVRNHPLATWFAHNMPVVLSSDDPGMWEAEPLTHDFYVAFVAVANRHADLRMLKKLALNSINYSTYPEKDKMLYEFERRWTMFIYWVMNKSVVETDEEVEINVT